MGRTVIRLLLFLFSVLLICSCIEVKQASQPPPAIKVQNKDTPNLMRIVVSPNYPPVIFIQGEKFAGIKADFARLLPSELNRPVKMVPYPWNDLFRALLAGDIDVIMSGVTVTRPRQMRMFTIPYSENRAYDRISTEGCG